jgi:hypothetical protein
MQAQVSINLAILLVLVSLLLSFTDQRYYDWPKYFYLS